LLGRSCTIFFEVLCKRVVQIILQAMRGALSNGNRFDFIANNFRSNSNLVKTQTGRKKVLSNNNSTHISIECHPVRPIFLRKRCRYGINDLIHKILVL